MSTMSLVPINTDGLICRNVQYSLNHYDRTKSYTGIAEDEIIWSRTSDLFAKMSPEQIGQYIDGKINLCAYVVQPYVSLKDRLDKERRVFTIFTRSEISQKIRNCDFTDLLDGSVSPVIIKIAGVALDILGNIQYLFVDKRLLDTTSSAHMDAIGLGKFLFSGSYDLKEGTVNEFMIERLRKTKIVPLEKDQYVRMRNLFKKNAILDPSSPLASPRPAIEVAVPRPPTPEPMKYVGKKKKRCEIL